MAALCSNFVVVQVLQTELLSYCDYVTASNKPSGKHTLLPEKNESQHFLAGGLVFLERQEVK